MLTVAICPFWHIFRQRRKATIPCELYYSVSPVCEGAMGLRFAMAYRRNTHLSESCRARHHLLLPAQNNTLCRIPLLFQLLKYLILIDIS